MKSTSRILEDLMARRGLVEAREGIGCWVSRGRGWVVALHIELNQCANNPFN
jgi:hypothetical protein